MLSPPSTVARLEQDPRLNLSGVKELDQVMSDAFRAEHSGFSMWEGMVMTDVREAAASALGEMGHHAEPALPALRRQLQGEKDQWARSRMEDAIKEIEKDITKKC